MASRWIMMAVAVMVLLGSPQLGIAASSAQTATPPKSPSSFPSVDPTAAKGGKQPPSTEVATPDRAVAGQPPALPQVKPGEELVDRRTANSKTFVGDQPGQLRTALYDGPVHFKDAQGRWADIDESLVAARDGRRHAAANAFDLSVASSSTDVAVARLAIDDKHSVGFSLDGAAKVTAKADGRSVTYPGVRRDTDVRLTSQASGLKEELILASPAAPDRFVFPLELKGLTASLNDAGDVVYRDETGVERARTPHGFMTDSNVDPRSDEAPMSLGVTYSLIPWGTGTALEVRLDRAWLDDPARIYPVVVDPEIHNAAWGDDTYVMSNFSRDNSWDAELKVGTYDGGVHIGRSYMHFDTGALAGASVQRAELHLAERHSWNCGYWPEPAYRVTQGWDGRTMRDFPGAAVDPNWVGGTWEGTTCGARTAKWDVTGMAGYWASVGETQGSLSLRATNEGNNNMYKKYASTEAGAPPALHVWYTAPNRPPAVPSGITPANGSVFGTPSNSVSAVYSDPDGGSGQLAFGVWNYQNQLVWSQWSGALCSGCRATLNVPALPDNWYYVMVIGHDGAQYSPAWSAQQWFFIDTLAPTSSQLTPANSAVVSSPGQVSARYSEPYGFSGYVYFWLYTTAGTKIVENWSALTASGSVATLAVPNLAPGTYNLWAMPWDTRQTGPQIGPNTFTVDNTPPAVTGLASPSHANPVEWYPSRDPRFSWSASDSSGITGYSFVLDASPATVPDAVSETTSASAAYTGIPRGQWWFHVRARDGAGLWGGAAHVRIRIDEPFPDLEFTQGSAGFQSWNDPWMVKVGSSGASTWQLSDMSLQPESSVSFAAGGAAASLGNLVQSALDIVRALAGDGTWEREYQALPGGAIIIDTLRSGAAPQVFPVTVTLPAGWPLSQDGANGDVLILDQIGGTRGHVSAATAIDAAGRAVPVGTTISGNVITTEVLHVGAGFTYPIVVDPYRYVGGNFGISRSQTTFYQWRQNEQTTKRVNGSTGEIVGEAKFTVTVTSRGNRQDPPFDDVHAHPQIRVEARPTFGSPEREFSLYVEIRCKENVSGAKDPTCKDENGAAATAEYDSTETGQPFRSSYDITRDVSLGDWPDAGERRFYFYEVRVLINWRVGEPAIDRPDLGKYRTYDMTCTSTECYFDRRRPTGTGG
ncbi:MAG: DNRLRE domain-containing protein [Acidimicrobiales bacterium]